MKNVATKLFVALAGLLLVSFFEYKAAKNVELGLMLSGVWQL